MSLQDMKIKLTENKAAGTDFPKYSLGYVPQKSDDINKNSGYGIISALKQNNDIIVEINDSLLSMKKKDRDNFVTAFLQSMDSLNISHAKRNVPHIANRGILGFFSKPKLEEAVNICFYLTNDQWNSPEFQKVYPKYGARYYICSPDKPTSTEALYNMSDDERLNTFEFMIFDSGILRSMGINSKIRNMADIKALLGI